MNKKEEINKLAEKTLGYLKYDGHIDIVKIANNLGFVVGLVRTDMKAFILVDKKDKNILNQKSNKVIGVSYKLEIEEKIYLVAYELGNFLLNKGNVSKFAHTITDEKIIYNNDDNNYFVNSLLMPKERFIKDVENLSKEYRNPSEICEILQRIYNVPTLIILKRIEELEETKNIFKLETQESKPKVKKLTKQSQNNTK